MLARSFVAEGSIYAINHTVLLLFWHVSKNMQTSMKEDVDRGRWLLLILSEKKDLY